MAVNIKLLIVKNRYGINLIKLTQVGNPCACWKMRSFWHHLDTLDLSWLTVMLSCDGKGIKNILWWIKNMSSETRYFIILFILWEWSRCSAQTSSRTVLSVTVGMVCTPLVQRQPRHLWEPCSTPQIIRFSAGPFSILHTHNNYLFACGSLHCEPLKDRYYLADLPIAWPVDAWYMLHATENTCSKDMIFFF